MNSPVPPRSDDCVTVETTAVVPVPFVKKRPRLLTSPESFVAEVVRTIVYALAIVLVVRTFLYQPFSIPSGSMKDTLLVGDYILVSKFAYGYSRYSLPFSPHLFDGRILGTGPERGDVVVFRPVHMADTDFIKRVIGLPGDRIQMKDGILFINDQAVGMEQIDDLTLTDAEGRQVTYNRFIETLPEGMAHEILSLSQRRAADNTQEFSVPEGHYFMMGDNRDESKDSRFSEVGFVPVDNIVGRADVIFFSADGSASFWEFWNWPFAIRHDRLFKAIH